MLAIPAHLHFETEVRTAVVAFVKSQGSLLSSGGAPASLGSFFHALNEETWFVVDGSAVVSQSASGARPGETKADFILIF